MHYVSTRDQSLSYTAAQAIEQGLSRALKEKNYPILKRILN